MTTDNLCGNQMATRTDIDWEAIEIEYRADQLSLRELGRQHGISYQAIQKRVKKEGWEKDLGERVRKETAKKLIKEDAGRVSSRAIDEDSIVDQAANRLMTVIQLHRKDIEQQRVIAADLMEKMLSTPTKKVMVGRGKDRHEVSQPLGITEISIILRNIAQAAAKYIPLERQAYNADTKAPTGSETDPIHVKHSMDTSGLQKAAEGPQPCGIPQLEEGKPTD